MSYTSDSSAYVILVNDDNTMTTTQKRRIVQRSKLVDILWFLVPPKYNEHNLSNFTVLLEYLLPVSRKYRAEILTLDNEMYNGYLKYHLPFNTDLTSEAGDIEFVLTFLLSDLDEKGNVIQRSRKVTGITITVVPISAWSDIIPDEALTALDQRILKTDAQIKALSDISESLYNAKADDISYDEETNEIQLLANGVGIGSKVAISGGEVDLKDGIPVVDFTTVGIVDTNDEENNVIEF